MGLNVEIFIYICRFAHVALSLLTLLDVVLVSRLNVSLGISDQTMVLFGSALSDAVNQFKYALLYFLCVYVFFKRFFFQDKLHEPK